MTTLKEILLSPENRPNVIADTVRLVESEVQSKTGISGMAIKTGFTAVNRFKPSLITDTVDNLLDRFVERLEPFYGDWLSKGKPDTFERTLVSDKNGVANALLAVTDERAKQVEAGLVRKTYEKLRPMGEKNVEAAVPGLAKVIERYLG